jgi:hypothetical protein
MLKLQGETTMKKSILVIVLIIAMVLTGISIFIFRERPLIPEGYTIQYIGGSFVYEDSTSFDWEEGRTLIEYNPDYPDYRGSQFLLIDSKELEAILKTAKCRASLKSFGNHFSGAVKYQFHIVLENGDKIRHIQLYIGTNSFDNASRISYEILNAEEIISALDAAVSTNHIQ